MRSSEAAERTLPPVIILGGAANALSIARSLGRRGVRVYAINEPAELVRYSRFCTRVPIEQNGHPEELWPGFLLGPDAVRFEGAVLLAASDAGLMVIAKNRDALARRFVLDVSNPDAQLRMLNKLSTYRVAATAGVATPKIWPVERVEDVRALEGELIYPLLVKPQLSHVFEARFGTKFLTAHDFGEVVTALEAVERAGIGALLMELVPGPDSLLCSYYTYIDESGREHFDFTKRVIRRYPVGMGGGSYHVTDWIPEARTEALKLFRAAGLRGLANAEFKLDPRDGTLKLIECNARFTAANCLVADAGMDLAAFVYFRLIDRPLPPFTGFRSGVRLWDPINDFYSFRDLRSRGEIGAIEWIRGLLHRQTFPFFRWNDPLPSLVALKNEASRILANRMPTIGRLPAHEHS